MEQITIQTTTEYKLPFTIESDSQGRSWIESDENDVLHVKNRLGSEIIDDKIIDLKEAKRLIREVLELRSYY